jgi:hypothetical protein
LGEALRPVLPSTSGTRTWFGVNMHIEGSSRDFAHGACRRGGEGFGIGVVGVDGLRDSFVMFS